MAMAQLQSTIYRLGLLSALSLTGCAYPMNSGPYPPMAGRPMMGPTGYAPANQQVYGGPVAIAPTAVTTFAPTAPTIMAAGNPGGITYFNVRPGDSITSVATLYGVSETELRKTNNLKPGEQIAPGQLVRIPDGSTAIR